MLSNNYFKYILLLLLSLLIGGCGSDLEDLRAWVKEQQAVIPPPIEPLPEIKPYETFLYAAEQLRDPFRLPNYTGQSVAKDGKGKGPHPDFNRRKELLEAFPLDSLSMVGTYKTRGVSWGLIQDPDGIVHKVKAGNYLGLNYGKITRVQEDRVVLKELVPDGNGAFQERDAKIALDDQG